MYDIKKLRKISGLSQNEFSNKYFVPLKTLQNWEADKNTSSYRQCPKYVYRLLKKALINDYRNEFIDFRIDVLTNKINLDDKFIKAIRYALNAIINSDISMHINDVVLYGSTARGENKKDGDVDILLVLDESIKKVKGYQKSINKLKGSISTSNINDPENDLHVVYGGEYKKANDAYYKNIMKDGVSIWN